MGILPARAACGVAIVVGLLATGSALAKPKPRTTRDDAEIQSPGTLVVLSTTSGALVEIDGKLAGTLPMDEDGLAIEPGQHAIRVSLRGWTEFVDTFEVKPGEQVELEIDLLPIAGIVRVTTQEPGASVSVNGKIVGVTPFDQDVTAGAVVLAVKAPGYHEEIRRLDIQAGQTYDLPVTLREMEGGGPGVSGGGVTTKWWFWTVLGAVVAGGATAVAIAASGSPEPQPDPDFVIELR